MLKIGDRVRFIDSEKDKQYGVLVVINVKGQFVTCGNGDGRTYGAGLCTVHMNELKKSEK